MVAGMVNLVGVSMWTKRLIPNRRSDVVDYFLKQFLTGLGCFRSYLQRMRADNNKCPYCRNEDTPVHFELDCERWENERRRMFGEFGESGLVERMVQSGEGWSVVAFYLRSVIAMKEGERKGLINKF